MAFIKSFVTMFPLGAFSQYIFRQANLAVKHWNHKRLLETLDSGAKQGPWHLRNTGVAEASVAPEFCRAKQESMDPLEPQKPCRP